MVGVINRSPQVSFRRHGWIATSTPELDTNDLHIGSEMVCRAIAKNGHKRLSGHYAISSGTAGSKHEFPKLPTEGSCESFFFTSLKVETREVSQSRDGQLSRTYIATHAIILRSIIHRSQM